MGASAKRASEARASAACRVSRFYHAVYLGAGDYGIGFVIPVDAPWIGDELRQVLESLLDDPNAQSFRFTFP